MVCSHPTRSAITYKVNANANYVAQIRDLFAYSRELKIFKKDICVT